MTDQRQENPLGIKGINYLEFVSLKQSIALHETFLKWGMLPVQYSHSKESTLYQQGQVRFCLTKASFVTGGSSRHTPEGYLAKHGEGVSKLSFWVDSVEEAYHQALKRGAKAIKDPKKWETPDGPYSLAMIEGFGDVVNEFVERPPSLFSPEFVSIEEKEKSLGRPLKTRFSRIDHLTNNVPRGEMDKWAEFYKTIFGFVETRYFSIKGLKTGLESRVVQLSNSQVIIPINQPDDQKTKSQIQEFLDLHKGAGVQHVALMTPQILSTVEELQERGAKFLNIPSTYYKEIPTRVRNVTEKLQDLERLQLLVDGDDEGYLLQNFTQPLVGPLFFEVIQRKNHWGFGEGNFQALFDAIERDQAERGII